MLYAIAVALLILWLLGTFALQVGSGLIHLLLLVAIFVVLYRVFSGRRTV